MAPNPNPARTTDQMWAFIERVLALEPADFVFAGAYVFKTGYHSTVADNLQHWAGNYSIRLPADLRGPRDKGRALDIKSRQAASGAAPAIMAKYGGRMRAAAKARDPRVRKWREVLGQFDTDTPPEAIDFQTVVERVPDDTHVWHFHFSILTEFVADPEAYDAMHSVLIGQSLADYQTNGATEMNLTDQLQTGPGAYALPGGWTVDNALSYGGRAAEQANAAAQRAEKAIATLAAKVDALTGVLADLVAHINAGGGEALSVAAILAGVDTRLAALAAEQRDAVADLGEGGAAQVRADEAAPPA